MADSLKTTTGTGAQTTTQTPQASAQASGIGAGQQSASVQPGTVNSLLTTSNGGVLLSGSSLTKVSLASSGQSQAVQPAAHARHVNPALFGFSIVLFLVAVYLFWSASRSAKNTTI